MTYAKKKIAIEVDVPDGATHYEIWSYNAILYRKKDKGSSVWSFWAPIFEKWLPLDNPVKTKLKPIEVIE